MIRAKTKEKGKTTRQTKKPGKSKSIIKALNRTLNTTRLEKENLEWLITRFERNYAEVEKLRKTLSPLLLSALLLRHAQLPEVDVQVISMNLESDPRVTNAARTIGSCKASMRRLQYNKIISHLTSERSAISSNNRGDDHKPKVLIRLSSG